MKRTYYKLGAMMTLGMCMGASGQAFAGDAAPTGNNFSVIAENITDSVASLPGLLSAMSYLFGILLGVLGVMKIKDHVENPTQTPLKDGAIRLAAGGALFALPILFESMLNTIGEDGAGVGVAEVEKVQFNFGSSD